MATVYMSLLILSCVSIIYEHAKHALSVKYNLQKNVYILLNTINTVSIDNNIFMILYLKAECMAYTIRNVWNSYSLVELINFQYSCSARSILKIM